MLYDQLEFVNLTKLVVSRPMEGPPGAATTSVDTVPHVAGGIRGGRHSNGQRPRPLSRRTIPPRQNGRPAPRWAARGGGGAAAAAPRGRPSPPSQRNRQRSVKRLNRHPSTLWSGPTGSRPSRTT